MKSLDLIKKMVTLVSIILFLLFSISLVLTVYYSTLSFDGAMNFQVSKNLFSFGEYATNYNGITVFDHTIQTGSPLLFPVAIVFFIFGINIFTAQIPSVIYLLLLTVTIYYVSSKLANNWISLITLLVFLQTPFLLEFAVNGYGEIPTLFFILLGTYFFYKLERSDITNKNRISIFIGILFGLAYLTKTIALIAVPSFLIVFLLDVLLLKKNEIRYYILISISFFVPVILFEIYKFLSLGYYNYVSWWSVELSHIFSQSGVTSGFQDSIGIFDKLTTHFLLLSGFLDLPPTWLLIFLIVPYILIATKVTIDFLINKLNNISISILFLSGISSTYLIWWLLVTPTSKAWMRRIINGVLIHEIITIFAIYICWRYLFVNIRLYKIQKHKIYLVGVSIIIISLSASVLIYISHSPYLKFPTAPSKERIELETFVESINDLPENAKLYGVGWWQAPVISFASNKNIYDINKIDLDSFNNGINNYFIVDSYLYSIGKSEMESVLNRSDYKLINKEDTHYLYKINNISPYKKFTTEERDSSYLLSSIDYVMQDYSYVRGLYAYEGNKRWSMNRSSVLLKYSGENLFYLSTVFPDIQGFVGGSVSLKVSIEDNLIGTYLIDRSGEFAVEINLSKIHYKNESVIVNFELDKKWQMKQTQDKRDIAFILNKVGFFNK